MTEENKYDPSILQIQVHLDFYYHSYRIDISQD